MSKPATAPDTIRVRKTPVGNGLFAAKKFRKNSTVGIMTGDVIHDADYGSSYCVDLGKKRSLEPAAPFRFLNHSCDPNCQLQLADNDKTKIPDVYVVVLRTIQPEEELTIDYGWTADAAIPCLCGSEKCRGWIVCDDDLPKVLAAAK